MAALCTSLAACGSDDGLSGGTSEGDGHDVAENFIRPGKKVRRMYGGLRNPDWKKWSGDDFVYDAQGYAVSAVYEHAGNESGTTVFTYTPDGYLLSAEGHRYKETFTWEGGNLVECIEYDSKGGDPTTRTYVYDPAMLNTYGIKCGSFNGYYDRTEPSMRASWGRLPRTLLRPTPILILLLPEIGNPIIHSSTMLLTVTPSRYRTKPKMPAATPSLFT